MLAKEEILILLKKVLDEMGIKDVKISLDHPAIEVHGDYSTNVAMTIFANKELRIKNQEYKNPFELAQKIADKFIIHNSQFIILERVEAVKPGFINFFISEKYLQEEVVKIINEAENYGSSELGKGKKVQVEFISANPTGPLTLGNGRGGFTGDAIANVLEKAGFGVDREYYVNDMGVQVGWILGASMRKALGYQVAAKEDTKFYSGKYVEELAKRLKGYEGFPSNWTRAGEEAAKIILNEMIKKSIGKMKIGHGKGFDEYFHESSLYKNAKMVKEVRKQLQDKGLLYEKDGATYFKTTKFGDDKDRVIIKKNGIATYFFSDILHKAYIMGGKYDKLVLLLGADHHGYKARLQAAMEAFGYDDRLRMIIVQLVRLIKDGEEVKMSKRSGTYVTLDELIDEVGVDAARYFFISYAPNSHMGFDIDLAKKKANDNPVFYIQYAHARISSILRKAEDIEYQTVSTQYLDTESELSLIRKLIKFPELVIEISESLDVYRLTIYAIEIADAFHKFYELERVISEDENLTKARLALVKATQNVLRNTLFLLGITAPEKM